MTDGLPALALVMDPADADVLRRPPRPPDGADAGPPRVARHRLHRRLLEARRHAGRVRLGAAPTATSAEARNLAFSTLVFGELFRAFAARSPTQLFWEVGVVHQPASGRRRRRVGARSRSASTRSPAAARLFHIQDLPLETRALPFLLALIPVTVLEVRKLLRRPA